MLILQTVDLQANRGASERHDGALSTQSGMDNLILWLRENRPDLVESLVERHCQRCTKPSCTLCNKLLRRIMQSQSLAPGVSQQLSGPELARFAATDAAAAMPPSVISATLAQTPAAGSAPRYAPLNDSGPIAGRGDGASGFGTPPGARPQASGEASRTAYMAWHPLPSSPAHGASLPGTRGSSALQSSGPGGSEDLLSTTLLWGRPERMGSILLPTSLVPDRYSRDHGNTTNANIHLHGDHEQMPKGTDLDSTDEVDAALDTLLNKPEQLFQVLDRAIEDADHGSRIDRPASPDELLRTFDGGRHSAMAPSCSQDWSSLDLASGVSGDPVRPELGNIPSRHQQFFAADNQEDVLALSDSLSKMLNLQKKQKISMEDLKDLRDVD